VELQSGSKEPLYQIMMARYYSSSLGRFVSPDTLSPIVLQQKSREDSDELLKHPEVWNRYSYVLNNPLAYHDPTGKNAVSITRGIGQSLFFWGQIDPMPWEELAGGALWVAAAILEARSNKDLFDKAMRELENAAWDLADPGHAGMNPEEPEWKKAARDFWRKIEKAAEYMKKITRKDFREKIQEEMDKQIAEWNKRFAGNPHGACGDNTCSGLGGGSTPPK